MLPINADTLLRVALPYSGPRLLVQRRVAAAIGGSVADSFACQGISSPLRVAHFLAQVCVECADFTALMEAASPAYCRRYDGRMGNSQPGDGFRFRGRGLFQLTGRDNYAQYARLTGADLLGQPDLAADPLHALAIACAYWNELDLSRPADGDDIVEVTRRINGGDNGLDQRRIRLARAKAVLADLAAADLAADSPADPVLHLGDQAAPVIGLQRLLRSAGYPVTVDGDFGPGTETAVAIFQQAACPPADGIVGPATWAALRQRTSGSAAAT